MVYTDVCVPISAELTGVGEVARMAGADPKDARDQIGRSLLYGRDLSALMEMPQVVASPFFPNSLLIPAPPSPVFL